jgi:hypothetical protein
LNFGGSSLVFSEFRYQLGDGAMCFASFSENSYRIMLGTFRSEFLLGMVNDESEAELRETLSAYMKATDSLCPFFSIYADVFATFLLSLQTRMPVTVQFLIGFLSGIDGKDIDSVDFSDMSESSLMIANLFIEDFKLRRARLKEDVDAIIGTAESYRELTPMQRLYLLSRQGRNYLSGEFRTELCPNFPIPLDEADLDIIKSTLLENRVDIVEMVAIRSLDDLLGFELFHTLKAGLVIRRCRHCGEFFVVRGRVDMEYCHGIKTGETKPCSIIGATRSYWGSKEGNAVYAEFQKAYKRNHSRRRVGTMTPNEFFEWSEEARRKRGECEDGRLPLDEFRAWLGNRG